MNLFAKRPATDPAKLAQIKTWVYETLALSPDIPVSISQLHCTEPGCPPMETVVAVMSNPVKQYKIHKPTGALEYMDISAAIQDK